MSYTHLTMDERNVICQMQWRGYCIGATLLDRDDPTKLIGRLERPLLIPEADERSGFVPLEDLLARLARLRTLLTSEIHLDGLSCRECRPFTAQVVAARRFEVHHAPAYR